MKFEPLERPVPAVPSGLPMIENLSKLLTELV